MVWLKNGESCYTYGMKIQKLWKTTSMIIIITIFTLWFYWLYTIIKLCRHSIENDDENGDFTDEFGEGISYIVDDYDLIEDENVDDVNQKTTANNN